MTDPRTIEVYEAEARRYADLPMSETQRAAIARFLSALPAGADILDLGCGPGLHAAQMQAAGHRVAAIDATPAFVEAARRLGVDARLGTFDDLTEIDRYDGVYASFSLLHAPRADLPRHVAAIARALRPGGSVFVGMKIGTDDGRDRLGRRYTYVTEAGLRGLLEDAGLTVTDVETGAEAGLSGDIDPFVLMLAHG